MNNELPVPALAVGAEEAIAAEMVQIATALETTPLYAFPSGPTALERIDGAATLALGAALPSGFVVD